MILTFDPVFLREERNQTQVLRQQQDEAYLASLRADQEKERKKKEEQEQRRQEEEAARQTQLAEERRQRVMNKMLFSFLKMCLLVSFLRKWVAWRTNIFQRKKILPHTDV